MSTSVLSMIFNKLMQEASSSLDPQAFVSNQPQSNVTGSRTRPATVEPSSPISPSQLGIPSKKYILYLEPSRDQFFHSILDFFSHSKERFALNEAQMYHPHCSMTGFFDLPNGPLHDGLLKQLDELFSSFSLETSPEIVGLHVRKTSSPKSLSVKLNVPSTFKDTVKQFQKTFQVEVNDFLLSQHGVSEAALASSHACFLIRPKPIDHISLAYTRPNTLYRTSAASNELVFAQELEEIEIDSLLAFAESLKLTSHKPDSWYVVLYEVEHKSTLIHVPHKFKEVKKWKVA